MSVMLKRHVSILTRNCQHCGVEYNLKGIASHERACLKRREAEREFEGRLAQDSNAVSERNLNNSQQDDLDNNGQHFDDGSAGEAFEHDEDFNIDDGLEVPNGDANNLNNPGDFEEHPNLARADITLIDPLTNAPIVDPVKIRHHPHTKLPVEIKSLHDFQSTTIKPCALVEEKPWIPFRTRVDFEYADIALSAGLTAQQNNALISLINRIVDEKLEFTFRNHSDVEDSWKLASKKLTGFDEEEFTEEYHGEEYKFKVFYRPLWNWALDLMGDARLARHFVWDAQKIYKYDKKDKNFVRMYDEPWTGNLFWDIQLSLPEDGKPFAFVIYADKNKLSSFGTQKGYPVVARCANLPVNIRNSNGVGGGVVIGWLPIVAEDAKHRKKASYANFKTNVWHRAMDLIMKSIRRISRTGCWVLCGDRVQRRVFPCILILSADYEEQAVMALIRGGKSNFPCTCCYVPKALLSVLSIDHDPRYAIDTKFYVDSTEFCNTQKEKEDLLRGVGLRNVKNTFWRVANSDPHQAISFDRLHSYHSGLFAAHLWPLLQDVLNKLGRKAEAKLDNIFRGFPSWKNLYHFDSVITITFNDGKKHGDLMKQLVFAAQSIIDFDARSKGYLILRLIRSLSNYIAIHGNEDKNFNFIKAHSHKHAFDDIVAKGATRNYNTKPNEKLHGPLRDIYHERTNFKNVERQILDISHQMHVATFIRSQINVLDMEALASASASEELEESEPPGPLLEKRKRKSLLLERNDKFYLGSPEAPCSFQQLENAKINDSAFKDLRKRFNKFINDHFNAYCLPFPDGKYIWLHPDHEIVQYKLIKVNYECQVTQQLFTDYLRCSPKFFNKPRYDYVLVDAVPKSVFAQLLSVFAIRIGDVAYCFALVQRFDGYSGPLRRKDKELNLWRIRRKPRADPEFIAVRSIIRGAVLVSSYEEDKPDDFLVMDILDGDMFLRTRQMRNLD